MKKMKKGIFSLMAVLVLSLALILTGCGGTSQVSVDDYSKDNPFVIKVSNPDSEQNVHFKAYSAFKDYVEEKTDGVIQVEIYNNGVLGGDQEVMQMIASNEVQISCCGTSVFGTVDSRLSILDLPFLFTSEEVMNEAINGGLGDKYKEMMAENGYHCFGFQYDGPKTVSSNKPINTLEDMKGLKIRVTDAEIYMETQKAMGANPVAVSYGEVYTAMKQGTVDAIDLPPMLTESNGWSDAVKYVSTLNQSFSNTAVYTSQTFMDSLPEEWKTLIEDAAKEYLVNYDREIAFDACQQSLNDLEANGIHVLDVDDKQEFIDAVAPVYDSFREILGDELIDFVLKYKK